MRTTEGAWKQRKRDQERKSADAGNHFRKRQAGTPQGVGQGVCKDLTQRFNEALFGRIPPGLRSMTSDQPSVEIFCFRKMKTSAELVVPFQVNTAGLKIG